MFLLKIKKANLTKQDFIIYLDMDGVIADFEKKVRELWLEEAETLFLNSGDLFRKIIDFGAEDFWFSLDLFEDTTLLVEKLKKYNVRILTTTLYTPDRIDCILGKRRWLQRHFPHLLSNPIFSRDAKDKGSYGNFNSILIDDRTSNLEEFSKNGGFSIHYKNQPVKNILMQIEQYITNSLTSQSSENSI